MAFSGDVTTISIDRPTKANFDELARRAGKKLAPYLRELANRELGKAKPPIQGSNIPPGKPTLATMQANLREYGRLTLVCTDLVIAMAHELGVKFPDEMITAVASEMVHRRFTWSGAADILRDKVKQGEQSELKLA